MGGGEVERVWAFAEAREGCVPKLHGKLNDGFQAVPTEYRLQTVKTRIGHNRTEAQIQSNHRLFAGCEDKKRTGPPRESESWVLGMVSLPEYPK
jgi:hypothetical protein